MQLNSLIGKKTYQKQGFLQDGTRVPLTGVVVAGNIVTQIKTTEKEGYNALQLGISAKKKANKAILGHVKKASDAALKTTPTDKTAKQTTNTTINAKFFREVRVEDVEGINLGTELQVAEIFAAGDIIDVTGVSKGKGWAGGVKRWGFHGGPRTHGQSDRERSPGSIGQTTTPGRVYRGKKMAGRMGSDTVTVKNLEIIEVTNDGVLLIKGLVPGRVNGLLVVKKTGVNKKFVPLYKEAMEEPVVEEIIEEKTEAVGDVPVAVEENVDGSQSHIAGDAQQSVEEQQVASASLGDNPAPSAEEDSKESLEPVVSSPANELPTVSDIDEVKKPKEDK
jgi:large subunit ribosomal protein L3